VTTSPYINRFVQPDTIIPDLSNPQSWNRYSYVTNRPIILNDPTGHDPITALLILVATAFFISACNSSSAYEGLTPSQTEIQKLIDKEDYQGAIDKTVELYDIDTHGVKPNYGENVLDAGRSTPYGGSWDENDRYVGGDLSVLIGPAAFASPDELVDTIAHESVHAEQFKNGKWYRSPGAHDLREIEAYDRIASRKEELEISDKLAKEDKDLRDGYYNGLSKSVRDRIDHGIYDLP
jgi:hypothetical protein